MAYDLDFEKPLADLDRQIADQERKVEGAQRRPDRHKPHEVEVQSAELNRLREKLIQQTLSIYSGLSP